MKNHLVLGGVVAVAALTGVALAHVSNDSSSPHSFSSNASSANSNMTPRQLMARMIAETAARSAAQAAKAVITNDGAVEPTQTASTTVPSDTTFERRSH